MTLQKSSNTFLLLCIVKVSKKMGQSDETATTNDTQAEFLNLPSEVYEAALNEIIKNNCDLSSDRYEVFCSAGSAKGDNYIGVVYRVSVKNKSDKSDLLNLIVKLPPQNAARREQFFVRPCFVREADFYDNIFPLYKKFQEDKGIDVEKDGFHQIPFCYRTLTEDPYEGLYFEDLKASGFEMFDRLQDITKDQVCLVMKALAKFHAIFYCLKDQKPELIQSYREIVDIFMQRKGDENMSLWFENVKKQAIDSLANIQNDDLKTKAESLLALDFFDLLETCIMAKEAEPYAVLCHGDVSLLNILI